MDIARKREATVNDMKSLEQQGASVRDRETNIDAVKQNPNPQCGKCGLNHGKNAQPKAQDAGNAISGTTGNRFAEVNKHTTGKPSHLKAGNCTTNQVRVGYM